LRDIGDARLEIGEALAGKGEPTASRTEPRPRRVGAWLALGIAAMGLAALGGWQAARRRATEPEPPIRLPVPLPQGLDLTIGIHNTVAISGDGRRLVLVAHGSDNVDVLVVRDLELLEPRVLAGTEEGHSPFFSPDGEWVGYFSANELRKVPFAGGPSERLAATLQDRGAGWSPGGSIVYAPDQEGGLVQVPANGGALVSLTELDTSRGERTHRWPHVLPGGHAVLFVCDTAASPQSYEDARVEAVSIGNRRRKVLVENASQALYVGGGHLVFVRGGSLFAAPFDVDRLELTAQPKLVLQKVATTSRTGIAQLAVSQRGSLLYVPEAATGDLGQLAWLTPGGVPEPTAIVPGQYFNFALAPDGLRLALTLVGERRNDLWVADLTLGTTSRLTFDGGMDPIWTPDGRRIAYQRALSAGLTPEESMRVLWKPADGSGEEEVLLESVTPISPSGFSHDGRSLIVQRAGGDGSPDIWLVPLAGGGEATPLVSEPRVQHAAELSPDGRWLAYASEESGRFEVYVRSFPGEGGKWQVSTSGGVEPHWARDGRALYFRNRRVIFRVAVGSGDAFSAGPVERVASGQAEGNNPRTYALAPDGRILFLHVLGDTSGVRTPVLVTSWAQELPRF
jgi:serine/threonine-protein kinase